MNGKTLERDTLGTCMAVLQRVQVNNGLCGEEKIAIVQLQQYLKCLDTSMDVDGGDLFETELDESARSYLQSFREKISNSRQHFLLEHAELVGDSPPMRLHTFEPATGGNQELLRRMTGLESLSNFNVFEVAKLTGGHPLEAVVLSLMHRYSLFEKLALPVPKLRAFLRVVEASYRDNPYHNSIHAADVVQSLAWLLAQDAFTRQLTDLELLCTIIAAAVHDVGHPGVRNDFLVNLGTEAAVRYNDNSVNENGHAALTFEVLYQHAHNFIAHMSNDERRFFRRMIVNIVLSTDMSVHDEQIKELKSKIHECGMNISQWPADAREHLLRFLVHTADITNPVRPNDLAQEWSRRIMQEFYAQGDKERAMGMPVSALCDRETTDWPKSQLVFLDCVIRPVYETLAPLAPSASAQAMQGMEAARSHWLATTGRLSVDRSGSDAASIPSVQSALGMPKVPSNSVFHLEDVQ